MPEATGPILSMPMVQSQNAMAEQPIPVYKIPPAITMFK